VQVICTHLSEFMPLADASSLGLPQVYDNAVNGGGFSRLMTSKKHSGMLSSLSTFMRANQISLSPKGSN
jgi:hypothetical protein